MAILYQRGGHPNGRVRYMGVGSRGGACPPWIFKRNTNIVDRGLKVLFSNFFCYFSVFFRRPPPLEQAKWCYFSVFFANFRSFFFVASPSLEKFSADALGR